jgi:hypothetical protein
VDYTQPVAVTVTNSSGKVASNILVNGAAASSSTTVGLTTSGSAAVTLADNGSGADAGTYTVTVAPISGATYSFPTQTLTFTETAASLDKAEFTSPSSDISVPVTSPTATYTLQLTDMYGNPVNESGVNVSVWATGSSTTNSTYGQATVNGSVADSPSSAVTVTTNAQGQATVDLAAEAFAGAVWTLNGSIPAQGDMLSPLSVTPSNTMTVSNQVPASVGVALQDVSTGADFDSTGYAVAGDTVDATVTLKDQYGIPLTGTQNVELMIPAGLSGPQAPAGSSMVGSATWTPGASNTVTIPVTLNSSGVGTVALEAWSEGSASLTASIPGLTSSVSGSATMFIQPGSSTNVGLFYNGQLISSSNELPVTANTPVELTVEPTDVAGNPVASTYDQVDMLMAESSTGSFRSTPDGASISTVSIPAGTSSVDVYYVNGTTGSYAPETMLDAMNLALVTSGPFTVGNSASQTITANVYDPSGNFISGQTVTASVTGGGTLSSTQEVSGSSVPSVSFTYTAPSTGSGTATVTLTVPGTGMSTATLTQTVTINY